MRRLFDYRSVPRQTRTHILAAMLFGSVLSYVLIVRFVMTVGEVEGDSMLPTLREGDRYLINRMVYRIHEPQPGDIVEIHMSHADDFVVKRIIALAGDVVQIKGGRVYVNGRVHPEPYLPPAVMTEGQAIGETSYKVAENAYFVLGDNRSVSVDSRVFGAVQRDHLVGRVWVW